MLRYLTEVSTISTKLLQEWGLMCVDAASPDETVFIDSMELNTAHASFTGPNGVAGIVAVSCQAPFMFKLSENVLGLDDDNSIGSQMQEDALKELANMLTGLLVTKLCGEDAMVKLTVPIFQKRKLIDAVTEFDEDTRYFFGDGEPIAVSCRIFAD